MLEHLSSSISLFLGEYRSRCVISLTLRIKQGNVATLGLTHYLRNAALWAVKEAPRRQLYKFCA